MFFQTSLRRAVLPTPTRRLPISLSRKWLTTEQKQIVKSTIPALEQHGVESTTLFYKRTLEAHP